MSTELNDLTKKVYELESCVAVNKNRLAQLERRCDKKDTRMEKIESDHDAYVERSDIKFNALFGYQNRAIGYAMCAGGVAAGIFYIFINKVF